MDFDPDAALARARTAVSRWNLTNDTAEALYVADTLANAFHALDEWLANGGALPARWGEPRQVPASPVPDHMD